MPIAINGSAGTVTGIVAGGLPDGIIQSADLATGVGGKILQVQQTHYSDRISNSTASGAAWAPSQLNCSITPSATTSKVLITAKIAVGCDVNQRLIYMSCHRDSTQIAQGDSSGDQRIEMSSVAYIEFNNTVQDISFQFLDTPSTTSATTYSFRFTHSQTATMNLYINRGGSGIANRAQDAYLASNVILQEVAA